MPANRFNAFTDYGIGIGLRVPHYRHILEKKPVVDWFEIISENFMVDGGRPLEVLDQIMEQYRVVQHGVSMAIRLRGQARSHPPAEIEVAGEAHEDALALGSPVLGQRRNTPYTHDLLPMPYTFAAARRTAEKIRQIQRFKSRCRSAWRTSAVIAEYNHVSEMSEWEFLSSCRRAGRLQESCSM